MKKEDLISIGKAAKILNVSIATLRRWDKSGKLAAIISPRGHRKYMLEEIKAFSRPQSQFSEAFKWVLAKDSQQPKAEVYCPNSSDLQFRVKKLETSLSQIENIQATYPLIVAAVGEIANNSFDHNLGNWPDIPGIFFATDLTKRQIVLADRGQGILKTLKRVKPELATDAQALETAFTQVISGRAPEERGNGLKFVKKIVPLAHIRLFFQTGEAALTLTEENSAINIAKTNKSFRGCLALITF